MHSTRPASRSFRRSSRESRNRICSSSDRPARDVHRVRVFYREPTGERHEVEVDFERMEAKLRTLA